MSNESLYGGKEINYINAEKGLWSWLVTTDHKRIAILYLIAMMVFFTVAVCLALAFRLELMYPGAQYFDNVTLNEFLGTDGPGEVYNRFLTIHGVIMVFLFVIPGIPAVFGNFFLPIMLGAEDVSFPKLNLGSWYCYMIGAVLALCSVLFAGAVDTGWTFYVPYSYTTGANVVLPLVAAFMLGWSSILTGLNFVTTVHQMRHKKMGWFQMPLFTWSLYATGWVQILATPVVGILLMTVIMERFFGIGILDPAKGGDPILFEHIFWIYSHPAVYIMVLPGMGVATEIISTFSRKTIFGYKFIVFSSLGIAGIGSLVWAHHMFTSGMSDVAKIVFSFLTFFVAIPTGVKVFNWVATMYKGSIKVDPPMFYTLMFIFLFCIGGFTGLVNGALSADIHLHDTAWVVAHFHYTMFGGGAVMFFASCHYWFPKMFGRYYNKSLAYIAGIFFFIGFNLTYIPLFMAGMDGMPRRYWDYIPGYQAYHWWSTIGAMIMASSLLLMFANLFGSIKWGKKTTELNMWGSKTMEWLAPTPPPTLNFHEEPEFREPYEYPVEVEK